MTTTERLPGRLVLIVGHAAGMLDLVAMPLWVGVLMQHRGLSAQQAGLMVTLYIAGVFLVSLTLAPRFTRLAPRWVAVAGFAVGALGYLAISATHDVALLMLLHLVTGLGAGAGLSMVHGTISRSARPHRLFAIANLGVAIFSILFFANVPARIDAADGAILFYVLSGMLALAMLAAAAGFPKAGGSDEQRGAAPPLGVPAAPIILAFVGVALMSTGQAVIWSFIERLGVWRGFPDSSIGLMLMTSGFVNLMAPVAAALLERRLPVVVAASGTLVVHACLITLVATSPAFPPYAMGGSLLIFITIFGHTFMFGLISRLDPTGRAAASTPAMLTVGSAIGPVLGGTVVGIAGYPAVGWSAATLMVVSAMCFIAIGALRLAPVERGLSYR